MRNTAWREGGSEGNRRTDGWFVRNHFDFISLRIEERSESDEAINDLVKKGEWVTGLFYFYE